MSDRSQTLRRERDAIDEQVKRSVLQRRKEDREKDELIAHLRREVDCLERELLEARRKG